VCALPKSIDILEFWVIPRSRYLKPTRLIMSKEVSKKNSVDANEDYLQHFEMQREQNERFFSSNFNWQKIDLNETISLLCSALKSVEKLLFSKKVYDEVLRISVFVKNYKKEKEASEKSAKELQEAISSGKLSLLEKMNKEYECHEMVLARLFRSYSEATMLLVDINKVISFPKEEELVSESRKKVFENTVAELEACINDEWDV